jgi:ABC-2 type transport system ATP-binding protein
MLASDSIPGMRDHQPTRSRRACQRQPRMPLGGQGRAASPLCQAVGGVLWQLLPVCALDDAYPGWTEAVPPEMVAVSWPDDELALWQWCVRVKAMFICISAECEFRVLGSWTVRSVRSSPGADARNFSDAVRKSARKMTEKQESAEAAPAVRARAITKRFGDVIALDGIDLDVTSGRIHGVVGPNGAGKTTLLGILLGLATADSGSLEILGVPVRRALAGPDGVAGFVDGPGLYPFLTARRNLVALATLRGRGARTADIDEVLSEVGLTDVADDRVQGFSLGMRQRLGLAAALLSLPRLLVLDEPVNDLDPAGKNHIHRVLARLAQDGTAVVLSSHRMDDVEALCSEVTIIGQGRVAFSGLVDKLRAEAGELAYRLVTTDSDAAREAAVATPGVLLTDGPGGAQRTSSDPLVVRAEVAALDALVLRLVQAGVALRELAPVISPLEAAFLALTEQPEETR